MNQQIEYSIIEVSGVKIEVSAYKNEKAYRLAGSKGFFIFADKDKPDEEIIAYLIQKVLYPSVSKNVRSISLVGA